MVLYLLLWVVFSPGRGEKTTHTELNMTGKRKSYEHNNSTHSAAKNS